MSIPLTAFLVCRAIYSIDFTDNQKEDELILTYGPELSANLAQTSDARNNPIVLRSKTETYKNWFVLPGFQATFIPSLETLEIEILVHDMDQKTRIFSKSKLLSGESTNLTTKNENPKSVVAYRTSVTCSRAERQ